MSIAAGLRRLWLNVHLWLGLTLLLPVGLIGLSGAALEFQDELGRLLAPQRYAVGAEAPVAASVLLERARASAGANFAVASLRFPARNGDPVIANARGQGRPVEGRPTQGLRLWLDPASGRVLDSADPRGGLFGVAHQLHGSLLVPDVGRKIVGWFGWALLVSAMTGLWLWWPRGAFWRGFGWARGPLFTYNLHHLFGFWIAIPLAIVAASGVYISFPQSARALTNVLTHVAASASRGENNQRGGAPLEHTTLSIDDAAGVARAAAPGARLVSLTLPSRPRGEGAPIWRAELQDGAQTFQLTFEDAPQAAVRRDGGQGGAALLVRRIHDGRDQPLWWRAILALTGLAPALLGLTGLTFWLQRRRSRAG
jgi:uncharacterized iron-regulated membrane protein